MHIFSNLQVALMQCFEIEIDLPPFYFILSTPQNVNSWHINKQRISHTHFYKYNMESPLNLEVSDLKDIDRESINKVKNKKLVPFQRRSS